MRRFLPSSVALWAALSCGAASAQTVGDWTYEAQRSFYAATVNDSGNIFGQYCDPQDRSCMFLIAFPAGCREGARYPALLNADSGANTITLICRGALESRNSEGRPLYRYVFEGFDAVDSLVRNSKRLGIAFPMDGDEFRVFRFSLSGAVPAITAMRGAAERASAPSRQNTRDMRL